MTNPDEHQPTGAGDNDREGHERDAAGENSAIPPRSVNSLIRSYVRFVNKSRRKAEVIWMSYYGDPVIYKTLDPDEMLDVNTFVSHPWIFRDKETHEPLVVGCRKVFYPEAWDNRIILMENSRPVPRRAIMHITIPVYTLKENCIRTVRKCLQSKEHIVYLEIPQCLKKELQRIELWR